MSMEQVRQAERNIQNIAVWWHNVDGTGQTARKNRQNTAVWWHNVDGTGQAGRKNRQNTAVCWHNVDGAGQAGRKYRQNTAVFWHNVDGTGQASRKEQTEHSSLMVQCGWNRSDRQKGMDRIQRSGGTMWMEQVRQAERNGQNTAVLWHNVHGTGQAGRKEQTEHSSLVAQ